MTPNFCCVLWGKGEFKRFLLSFFGLKVFCWDIFCSVTAILLCSDVILHSVFWSCFFLKLFSFNLIHLVVYINITHRYWFFADDFSASNQALGCPSELCIPVLVCLHVLTIYLLCHKLSDYWPESLLQFHAIERFFIQPMSLIQLILLHFFELLFCRLFISFYGKVFFVQYRRVEKLMESYLERTPRSFKCDILSQPHFLWF